MRFGSSVSCLVRFVAATMLMLCATVALAWPEKPITLVVPFPPGGSTDQLARAIAPKLQESLKQNVVIDNRAGATGTIGASFVKRAPADGYTVFVTSLGPLVIAPHLLKNLAYDATKDFDYLTVAVQAPNVLVVPEASKHKSMYELMAALKAVPDKVTFASSGNGSSDHLSAELFWLQSGTSGVHVPYKGGGPAVTDLLGAQVDAGFMNINSVITHIRSGKLRALAMTSNARSPLLPNVPTLSESGIRDVVVNSWQGVAAPRGLSAEVKSKLHGALMGALADPQIKARFLEVGFEIVASSPEQFTAFQAQENARWKQIIETRKITAD